MYPSKRSILTILVSLALVVLTACGGAAPTEAPDITEAPGEPAATVAATERACSRTSSSRSIRVRFAAQAAAIANGTTRKQVTTTT